MNIYKQDDVRALIEGNSYVGRGIIVGKSEDGTKACVAYFIMGRSENSRNRVFVEKGDEVVIYPFDESKVGDPSLIIYSPIKKISNHLIVTNGNQTDTIYDALEVGGTFSGALATREFEPDGPNFTPRISAMLTFDGGDFTYEMSILKSIDEVGSDCCRYTYSYPSKAGLGHFIHTYICDGNPIPTFCGEPERVNVPNDIDAFTNEIWESLDENNKISLYVRYIDLHSGVVTNRMINKNVK
ncbi:MAG: IMP cyclohydrolase [Bacteroides sp.]|nr:IMP cyclohydrolase [Bacillota bacterium]MCM1393666.1 IMP cyclohydrolase [[Eubacterium] siraeum]MCM1455194.1 IMP cyclohydrolase [Bacteroides sp.]